MVDRLKGCVIVLVVVTYPLVLLMGLGLSWRDAYRCPGQSHCGIWQDAVVKSPRKLRPRVNVARFYGEHGALNHAFREYQAALLLSHQPGIAEREALTARQIVATNLGQMLLDLHTAEATQQAGDIMAEIWNEEPGFPGIAGNLGIVLIQQGHYQLAIDVLTAGLAHQAPYLGVRVEAHLHMNRGAAYQALGDCPKANADFKEALNHHDDSEEVRRMGLIPECKGGF